MGLHPGAQTPWNQSYVNRLRPRGRWENPYHRFLVPPRPTTSIRSRRPGVLSGGSETTGMQDPYVQAAGAGRGWRARRSASIDKRSEAWSANEGDHQLERAARLGWPPTLDEKQKPEGGGQGAGRAPSPAGEAR